MEKWKVRQNRVEKLKAWLKEKDAVRAANLRKALRQPPKVAPLKKKPRFDLQLVRFAAINHMSLEPPKSPFESGGAFKHFLQKKGYVILGTGAHATVLRKGDSDKVIKVLHQPDNWIDYCHWAAEKGYAGRFAPIVYSYKHIKGKKADFAIASMEFIDFTVGHVDRASDPYLTNKLLSLYGDSKNTMAGLFLDEMQPGLANFTKDLYTTFRGSLDMHGGNTMVRKNGSLCVTDPIYGRGELSNKRLKARDFSLAA